MATRSRIGILQEDGSVRSIYAHWDGYPEHNGKILTEEYTTNKRVEELLDCGDISSLRTDTNWQGVKLEEPVVLSYRDRGDAGTWAVISENEDRFLELTRAAFGEFAYVFNPFTSKWSCYDVGNGEFIDLYKKEAIPA